MTTLGTLIGGRYRLEQEIGRGGMSTVYRAFDTVLERPGGDQAHASRDRQRLRPARALSPRGAVGRAAQPPACRDGDRRRRGAGDRATGAIGTPYIVLEYVDGETLKDIIRRDGPMEITAGDRLRDRDGPRPGAAHERQIVHRDVKPHNILISEEGGAKITDFGIARSLSEEGLTMAGRVLGTTDYVSPEQALGHPVTGQSDVYSLGIVLYEMLTGDVPFHAESPVAVAMKHVRERRPGRAAAQAGGVGCHRLRGRPRGGQGPEPPIPGRRRHGRGPRGRARDRGLEVRAGDGRGHDCAADPPRGAPPAAALADAPPGEVDRLARAARGARRRRPDPRSERTHKGTARRSRAARRRQGCIRCSSRETAANDYNPFGTGPENRDLVQNVIDNDPNTTWSTEQYYSGTLKKAGGTGLGVYVDAAPGVSAKAVEIVTPTPGFGVAGVRGEQHQPQPGLRRLDPPHLRGWTGPVGADSDVNSGARVRLHLGGRRYRYYLMWMTTLPPGMQSASIAELALYR